MKNPTLQAAKRQLLGRKVKQLRRQDILPANIFGKKVNSQAVQINIKDFNTVFQQVGETNLVNLIVEKEKPRPVLITNVHKDPVTGNYLHADLHQVDITQKVTADIPVEIVGQAPAVKDQNGVLVTPLSEIQIEALPTNLPDKFEVDISSLKKVGDSLTIADLKVDTNIDILADKSTTLALIQAQKEEEEESAPTPAEDEQAATTQDSQEEDKDSQAKPEEKQDSADDSQKAPDKKDQQKQTGEDSKDQKAPHKK